jgi:tetratricopeptide (TPR) repeat protein
LGRHDEVLYLNMATARVCEHDYERAGKAFRAALSISPKATTWAYLGEVYGNQGRWPEAQQALEAAFRLDQNSALAYRVAGELFLKLNQVDQAAAAYQKALAIMPGDGLSQAGLAQAERAILARRRAAGGIQR